MKLGRSAYFCAVWVAMILAWAGVTKAADPAAFALDIANYRLVPEASLQTLAHSLPILEILIAVGLFIPSVARAAWLLAGCLFGSFAVVVATALIRGLNISCGCFGDATRVSWAHVLVNCALSGLCMLVVRGLSPEERPGDYSDSTG